MDSIIHWVQQKFDVLFSGLGVFVLSLIISIIGYIFFRSRSSVNKVSQKNIRAGGDVVGRDKNG